MAIQFDLTLGLDNYPKAYAKFTSQGSDNNAEKTSIVYNVSIWKSLAHKEAGEQPVLLHRDEVTITDIDTANFAGLYGHLHKHPMFSGGVMV